MANTSESGHAKNVANFERLTVHCTGLATAYNPSNSAIKLTQLTKVLTLGKNSIAAVNTAFVANSQAIAARKVAFEPLNRLTTRLLNALKASGTTKQVNDNAQSLVRKIQGQRATPKLTAEEKNAAEASGKIVTEISSSQMGFDNRINNLDKFIKQLSSTNLYAPNEAELKVSALIDLINNLNAKNTAVVSSATALSNARIARDAVIYSHTTGMVDISMDVKNYVKSLYGATSPQFKQVSKLSFTNRK